MSTVVVEQVEVLARDAAQLLAEALALASLLDPLDAPEDAVGRVAASVRHNLPALTTALLRELDGLLADDWD